MAGKVKDSSKQEVLDRVKKIKKRKETCQESDDVSAESLQCKGARKKSLTSKAPQQKDACEGEGNVTEELEYQAECCEDGVPELKMSKKKAKKCKKRRQHEEVSDETLTRKRKHDDKKADEETVDPVMKKGKKKKKNKSIELANCADVVEQGAFKNKKKTQEIEDQSGGDDASSEDPKSQETKKKKKMRKKLGDSETINDSHGLSDTHGDTGKDENTNGVKKAVVCKRKKRSKSESEGPNQKELDNTGEGDDVQSEADHADNAHHCSDENSDTVKRKKKKGQLQSNSDDITDNLEQRKKKNKRKTIEHDDATGKADVKAPKSKRKMKNTNADVDVAGEEDHLLAAHEHQPKTRGKKKQSPVGALDGEAPCKPNERKRPRKAGSISPDASGSSNECRAGTGSKGVKRAKAGGRKKSNDPDNLAENKQTDGSPRDQGETRRSTLKKLKECDVDNDVKFVTIKPGNVEEEKFDLARRVALQTQVDIMTGKVSLDTNKSCGDSGGDGGGSGGGSSTARATQFGQWDTACLGDATKQNKFLRLMGGFKKGSGHSGSELESGPGASGRANMALGGESENRLNSALESQFQHALQRKNYQQRGVGLGFQADASAKKTFFIDKAMSRSLKLE